MKRYYRSRTSNIIGGVCGGLGDYTGIDPVLWRVAFFLTWFLGPVTFWIYVTLWIASSKEPKQA
jgi:phage shock protein PspC (stress-responsive transcriptional regulator)